MSLKPFPDAIRYTIQDFPTTTNYSRATLIPTSETQNIPVLAHSPERFRKESAAPEIDENIFHSPDLLTLDMAPSHPKRIDDILRRLRETYISSQNKIETEEQELRQLEMSVEEKKKNFSKVKEAQNRLQQKLVEAITSFEDELRLLEDNDSSQE